MMILALAAGACSDRSAPPPPPYDAPRVRRVFKPPPGEVRAVPPHAIHAKGVGPYALGTSLKDILGLLPHGPRVALMEIDDVVDYSLVRTEADSLIIGVKQPYGVSFVTVLDDEIARTEAGVGVGATARELRKAMGPELASARMGMDPRLIGFERLPNVRFVLAGQAPRRRIGRSDAGPDVVAVVVREGDELTTPDPAADAVSSDVPGATSQPGGDAGPSPTPAAPCRAATRLGAVADEIAAAARLPRGSQLRSIEYGCFTGNPEALVVASDRLVVVGGEPGKLRRVAIHAVPELAFAAALDHDDDGRHEAAVVTQSVTPQERSVRLELLRVEPGRMSRLVSRPLYQVSSTSAAWVGARVEDIELLVELWAGRDSIRATGFYVSFSKNGPPTVAPLLPKTIAVRRKRVPALAPSASTGDAAVTAPSRAGDAGAATVKADARTSPVKPSRTPVPGG